MSTSPNDNNLLNKLFEVIISNGSDGFRPVLESLLNESMKIERSQALQASPYERSENRKGYSNGFKPRQFHSRLGTLRVEIPQVRGFSFYPQSLEKGCRSELALKASIAEMYVQGVSTRRVTEITEALCGLEISSSQVSRITEKLDTELKLFRNRPLKEFPILILDARYESVRHSGCVRDLAVLNAIGISWEGKPEILGTSTSLSEGEVHWRSFLEGLQKRGLTGVQFLVSDDHAGMKKARKAIFPSVVWQRCQFHLAQNAQSYAPTKEMKPIIGQALRDIFNAASLEDARRKVQETIDTFAKKAPEFTAWLEDNIEEGFAVFQMPRSMWVKLRTSNFIENVNQQIKRRTRVVRLFPNAESCLRLVSAVLQEIHEDWVTGNVYLNMEPLKNKKDLTKRIYRKNVA
jgi:transposase-like protein